MVRDGIATKNCMRTNTGCMTKNKVYFTRVAYNIIDEGTKLLNVTIKPCYIAFGTW